jgi:GDP-4-dehydro-6-deoxy-D-mannose reductase
MRVLVTGASGFAGTYLCRALADAGHEVVAAASGGVVDERLDVTDREAVLAAVRRIRPQGIFHLAAIAYVPAAEQASGVADSVNRGGTASVLDAAHEMGARTLVVSSGAVYGRLSDAELPATEATPTRAVGVYAESKVAAEAECFARARRQEIVVVRPFNHTGPGQAREYVCSDFAAQLAECEAGLRPPRIEVGDLSAERDFCDVRDVVRGYAALFERGRAGEVYNLCAGRPVAVSAVLSMLRERVRGLSVEIVVRDERLRAGEVSRFYGSHDKATRETGWRPEIPLASTLADLLDDWRARIRRPDAP